MSYIIKQFLINSIKKLPLEILNMIKDYIFLSNIEQFIKVHKIKQNLKEKIDISNFFIMQRPLLGYEIYYGLDSEYVLYYPLIDNCNKCGEYLVDRKSNEKNNYVPLKLRCNCKF